jgi:hypothetical protein
MASRLLAKFTFLISSRIWDATVKEAAIKTNDIVGDGTTTATVLAHAIIREGDEGHR